jgi:ribulose-bisphosphate carboxylase small chain
MKTETFSYLPTLTREQIERQVTYMLDNDWMPAIEYQERVDPATTYRYWWRLPMFRGSTVADVLDAVAACRAEHPDAIIWISCFDREHQTQALSFAV